MLRVCNLSHTYADGRPALRDLNFTLNAGERLALVGPNGAGKTTLFLRLCGVLSGKPGHATIGDLDPANPEHRKKLPSQVGVVFQNPDDQLFAATLLEDVAFGPLNLGAIPTAAKQLAETALKQVGLIDAGDRTPHKLSGGEKRRAAIAGVLAMKPNLLLLDEPSMFLDPRGRRELIRLLNELPCTLLIATHDLELVRETCPRVIVLDGGELVIDGPTADVFAHVELMDRHGLEVMAR